MEYQVPEPSNIPLSMSSNGKNTNKYNDLRIIMSVNAKNWLKLLNNEHMICVGNS